MTDFEQLTATLSQLYPPREAQTIANWFWEDAFGLPKQQALPAKEALALQSYLQRLAAHEPWQYVLGEADFYGLKWKVSPAVLIPRPETEELVHWVAEEIPNTGGRLLDIGTGSGCIAVMLQRLLPNWAVKGIDISPAALQIARSNAERYAPSLQLQQVDFLEQPHQVAQPWDCMVSNPPYIPQEERTLMRRNVLDYEPQEALFVPNAQPLLFYRAICAYAQKHLAPTGRIYLELHEGKGPDVAELFNAAGFETQLREDMSGRCRMLCASRKAP